MEPQKESNQNYLPYPPHPQQDHDEIDLRELFSILWKGKWSIIVTTFVFTLCSILYALSLPNIYKADALLAPTESSNGGGLSKMAGQLGGLAALAGVNLGSSETSQTELAVHVMKSRKFIESFISEHELLVPVMAVKGWSEKKNELVIDNELYDVKKNKWLRAPKGLRGIKPSLQEASEVFIRDIFTIVQDKESGLYTVSVRYYSPNISKDWVNWLIEDINRVMRERTISETSQNLDYLNTQLQKTSVADMQSTFYKLIEEQTKSLMLAEVQEEFVFKILDPAISPEIKDSPKRLIIVLLGIILGGVLSVSSVLVHNYLIKRD